MLFGETGAATISEETAGAVVLMSEETQGSGTDITGAGVTASEMRGEEGEASPVIFTAGSLILLACKLH